MGIAAAAEQIIASAPRMSETKIAEIARILSADQRKNIKLTASNSS